MSPIGTLETSTNVRYAVRFRGKRTSGTTADVVRHSTVPTVTQWRDDPARSIKLRGAAAGSAARPARRRAPLLLAPQFNFGGSSSLRSVRDAESMHARSLAKPASVRA
jgi:hypothetical protein